VTPAFAVRTRIRVAQLRAIALVAKLESVPWLGERLFGPAETIVGFWRHRRQSTPKPDGAEVTALSVAGRAVFVYKHAMARLLPAMIMILLAGCGSTDAPSLELDIGSATETMSLSMVPAKEGDTFVVLALTLKNIDAKVALSTNPVLFSLSSKTAIVFAPSPVQPADACDPAISLAVGGQVDCSIAYEVPIGTVVTTLSYNDQQGNLASVAVPAIVATSDTCATVAPWLGELGLCGTCISQSCVDEKSAYHISCNACEAKCDASFDTLCTCEATCDSTSCQSLFETYTGCLAQLCASSCP